MLAGRGGQRVASAVGRRPPGATRLLPHQALAARLLSTHRSGLQPGSGLYDAQTMAGVVGAWAALSTASPPAGGRVRLLRDTPAQWTILLDHPRTRNALTPRMMLELREIVLELEVLGQAHRPEPDAPPLPLLVMRGAGGTFCTGLDLATATSPPFAGPGATGGRDMGRLMTDTLFRLGRLPHVSVAWLEGWAMGGGAELATATDLRWMDPQARVQFVQASRGITPGWGGGSRLKRILDYPTALHYLLTCAEMPAFEAFRLGFAQPLPPDATLPRHTGHVVCGMKRAIRAGGAEADEALRQELRSEVETFAALWGSVRHRKRQSPRAVS